MASDDPEPDRAAVVLNKQSVVIEALQLEKVFDNL
jgi:hypothetical protein